MGGDRICPDCEQESLIECSGARWKCLNPECGSVHYEEDLDGDIEEMEDEEECQK